MSKEATVLHLANALPFKHWLTPAECLKIINREAMRLKIHAADGSIKQWSLRGVDTCLRKHCGRTKLFEHKVDGGRVYYQRISDRCKDVANGRRYGREKPTKVTISSAMAIWPVPKAALELELEKLREA